MCGNGDIRDMEDNKQNTNGSEEPNISVDESNVMSTANAQNDASTANAQNEVAEVAAANEEATADNSGISPDGTPARGFQPKTEEEKAREAKKRRSQRIIASVGDGLMSLSNLFFSMTGAPSMISCIEGGGNKRGTFPFLSNALKDIYAKEDKAYSDLYAEWEKEERKKRAEKEKQDKANSRINLSGDISVLASNWEDGDFINELFEHIRTYSTDKGLGDYLDVLRNGVDYGYVWNGHYGGWQRDRTRDKRKDFFNGKPGLYFKREILKSLLSDDSFTSPETRANAIELFRTFEDNWHKLK